MDTKEKHIRENESNEKREAREARERSDNADMIAREPLANGRERKRESTRKINRLWLWFGVLILIAILLWWLFTEGMFADLVGATNG